jgi:hypothetical protein
MAVIPNSATHTLANVGMPGPWLVISSTWVHPVLG